MGLRFQKRVKLLKGLTLNLSKGGASVTVGKKGASINIGKDGVTGNAGIPGTGVSYREKLSGKSDSALGKAIVWLIVIGAVGAALGGASLERVIATILSFVGGKG